MRIWKSELSLDQANGWHNTMIERIGIAVTDIGDDYVRGTMPVDARTHQPYGLLHGGASVALAETLGSLGAMMCADAKTHLDAAVKAGRLSSAEEQRVLADLEQRIDNLVNGKLPDRFPRRHGFGFRDRQGPPAVFADPAA